MSLDAYDLKNYRSITAMSEETECFSADLWVDGKKFAHVSNDGRGGCDRFTPYPPQTMAAERALSTRLVTENPDSRHFKDPGSAVEGLTMILKTRADLVKKMRSAVVFIDGTEVKILRTSDKKSPDQRHFDYVLNAHPGSRILNQMSINDAAVAWVDAEFARFDDPAPQGFAP